MRLNNSQSRREASSLKYKAVGLSFILELEETTTQSTLPPPIMARIDVEQAIEELTLGEKVALTAG